MFMVDSIEWRWRGDGALVRIAHTSMPWTPLSPSIHSQLGEMDRFIYYILFLAIILASSQAASTPTDSLGSLFSAFAGGSISANISNSIKDIYDLVKAETGPYDVNGIESEIQSLKASYNQIYKLLSVDDAAKLGGYIIRLDKLAIVLAQAGPYGDLTLLVAHLALAGRVLNIAQRGVRLAGNGCSLAQRILALQLAIQKARGAGLSPRSILTSMSSPDATSQLVNIMISASTDLNTKMLPWAMRGGLLSPLNAAIMSLNSAQSALGRISALFPNQG
jgi:hypothetical protein